MINGLVKRADLLDSISGYAVITVVLGTDQKTS